MNDLLLVLVVEIRDEEGGVIITNVTGKKDVLQLV